MNKFTKAIATATLLTIFATGMAFSTDEETLGPAASVDMNLMGTVDGLETITLTPGVLLNSVDLRTTDADTVIGTMTLNNTDRDGFTLTFTTDSEATYTEALMILQNEADAVGSIATKANAGARTNSEGYFIPWQLEVQLDENPTNGAAAAGFETTDPVGTSGGTAVMAVGGGDPQGAIITIDDPQQSTIGAVYNLKAHTTAVDNLFDGTYNATLNVVMADII